MLRATQFNAQRAQMKCALGPLCRMLARGHLPIITGVCTCNKVTSSALNVFNDQCSLQLKSNSVSLSVH
jgi:hypothetical protein